LGSIVVDAGVEKSPGILITCTGTVTGWELVHGVGDGETAVDRGNGDGSKAFCSPALDYFCNIINDL
jgi:hypothetical protein